MRYGPIHRTSDFIDRLVPKRGSGAYRDLFVHDAVDFLKGLEEIQAENLLLTLSVRTQDGIWLRYSTGFIGFILPAQAYLRIGIDLDHEYGSKLNGWMAREKNFEAMPDYPGWGQWRARSYHLDALLNVIGRLPNHVPGSEPIELQHARSFPGPLREKALSDFESGGRVCPGAAGNKRHKLKSNTTIEFDHILPHARGGSNSEWNIQVLCWECNRKKRATGG